MLGVLGCPNLERADGRTGSLFVAERGGGAWELALDGDATRDPRLGRADHRPVAGALRRVAGGGPLGPGRGRTRSPRGWASATPPLRLDSQAKYGLVARGDASIYLRIPRGGYVENVWDHAAGAIVVTEAGGIVSDIDGLPLDLTTGRRLTRNRGIIAAPAAIHGAVVAAARAVLAPPPPEHAAGHIVTRDGMTRSAIDVCIVCAWLGSTSTCRTSLPARRRKRA